MIKEIYKLEIEFINIIFKMDEYITKITRFLEGNYSEKLNLAY